MTDPLLFWKEWVWKPRRGEKRRKISPHAPQLTKYTAPLR